MFLAASVSVMPADPTIVERNVVHPTSTPPAALMLIATNVIHPDDYKCGFVGPNYVGDAVRDLNGIELHRLKGRFRVLPANWRARVRAQGQWARLVEPVELAKK
jgi:hypothetical protein